MTTTDRFESGDVAELYALLSRCFEKPDESFHEALRSGRLDDELDERLAEVGLSAEPAPIVEDLEELRRGYRRTFEAYDGPSAPPVESVYEPWWDGRVRGILSGPAAADMRRRFDELDVEVPDAYPEDHLALLLEYANLLLEAGRVDAYVHFHDEHFDWISDFATRVEETADDPFYAWAVSVLERTIDRVGQRLLGLKPNREPDERPNHETDDKPIREAEAEDESIRCRRRTPIEARGECE